MFPVTFHSLESWATHARYHHKKPDHHRIGLAMANMSLDPPHGDQRPYIKSSNSSFCLSPTPGPHLIVMNDAAIYSEQLAHLHNGYALFEPDPESCGFDKVRVGDVGYTKDGSFCRLFNVCAVHDDPRNSRGVPAGFEPLSERFREVHRRTCLPSGLMSSRSVRKIAGNINLSGSSQ